MVSSSVHLYNEGIVELLVLDKLIFLCIFKNAITVSNFGVMATVSARFGEVGSSADFLVYSLVTVFNSKPQIYRIFNVLRLMNTID